MNVNQAWLSKSIGKYYSWLWYHSKNIEFITRGLRPLVINSIFFLVITITTRNIFQYFLTAMHDSTIHKSLIYEEWLELKYLVGHFFRLKKIVLWLFHKHRYLGYLGLHKICHFVTLCPQYKTCIQSTKYQFWSGVRVFSLPTHELSRTVSYNLDWSM